MNEMNRHRSILHAKRFHKIVRREFGAGAPPPEWWPFQSTAVNVEVAGQVGGGGASL